MKYIDFYKENGRWYADVPAHTQEENEMVAGADKFLDFVNDNIAEHSNELSIVVSVDNPDNDFMIKLIRKSHDNAGATYIVTGEKAKEFGIEGSELWLCNVVHTVLGEHPESIYIHDILPLSSVSSNSVCREFNAKARAEERMKKLGLLPHYASFEISNISREYLEKMYKTAALYLYNNFLI